MISMAIVKIKNEGIEIEVPDGSKIIHYLWDNSSFPVGCEDGSSTICSCVVLRGSENLNARTHAEIVTFAKANLPNSARNRLACQIVINKGEIEIEY
jgi:ferredoxin